MNPIEKQNIENFRARLEARWETRPWYARLRSLPIKAWRFMRWWFLGDESEKERGVDGHVEHLERCWEMDEREGRKL
ncbi:hypothetical protein [Adonisia turfae]|uniref:Uncharacterized protein n=1 Tax=Adonisia turfae CCMR0081 TaxID=2292702 RepID=A0A6M0RGF1_9CYAN|nr:hypothetical protein [Adonisia turfae]NEZ54980.1 hypothetical protein [Adonisia turfae CCMR0081]